MCSTLYTKGGAVQAIREGGPRARKSLACKYVLESHIFGKSIDDFHSAHFDSLVF